MALRPAPFSRGSACSVTQARRGVARSGGNSRPRKAVIVNSTQDLSQCSGRNEKHLHLNRRELLLASGAAIGVVPALPALALEGSGSAYSSYADPEDGFTLSVPPGWVFGEGELPGNNSFSGASGSRRTLVWFPEGDNPRDVNVTLVITNVSVEFTKLGSFGTPYQFGSTLVNSQDRSYLLRAPEWARGKEPIQVAKLVDAGEVSNRYFVEYTIQKLPEPQRHLYSLLALAYNGVYNRLYTITAQTLETDRPKYESTLLAMVRSLSVPTRPF